MIDLLAGVPSVVLGLFGVLIIVPFSSSLGSVLGVSTTGYNLLSGGIVLAIMVFPVIISLSEEVIRTVPRGFWEASLALGATRWQAAKLVVTRAALPGVFAAIVLGFGRAFGETMAVLMVVGNVVKTPVSIFDPAYPLPALIANNYGEMMSIPQYESALMLAALVLLTIVFITSLGSRVILMRMEKRYAI
jgi:phosphate transport system permease protein